MQVTRTSHLTGVTRTIELNITPAQLEAYENGAGLVQDIFPNLTNNEREFIMTGATEEEWEDLFKGENE